tara:strand:- start:19 stop:1083 length:1065 start_codon:yes stop_codon:yes gene_type:complete
MKKYLFFITILFISCQEEITLDLPNGEQKIVVQGTIENGLPPYVILTKNQGYFEEIGINTYSNLFIDDVDSIKVWYIENEIEVVKYLTKIPKELAEALTGEDIPLYTSTDLFNYIYFNGEEYLINEYSFSKAGRTYFLELNWNGKIVTAQTTIPLPTPLDSLWVEKSENSEKDYKCDIRAVYSDPLDIQNNILIKSKRKEHYERDREHSDTTLCKIIPNPDINLKLVDAGSDVLINGETFETYFPRPGDGGFPTGKYNATHSKQCNDSIVNINNDVVLIKFCQIDEPALRFWRGVVRQAGTNGNPFAEPLNLVSNINNGLGYWTGFGSVYYEVPIIENIVIKNQKDSLSIEDIF